MKHTILFGIIFLLLIAGCASQKEPVTAREPKRLITRDDYDDLKVKTPEEKPAEVDYKKEGVYRPSIDTRRK